MEILKDPAIVVLDEATSSLDMATEQAVMQAVQAARRLGLALSRRQVTQIDHVKGNDE